MEAPPIRATAGTVTASTTMILCDRNHHDNTNNDEDCTVTSTSTKSTPLIFGNIDMTHEQSGLRSLVEMPTDQLIDMLSELIQELIIRNASVAATQVTHFDARTLSPFTVQSYLRRIARFAPCNNECYILVLIYFDRLHHHQPWFLASAHNIHRLLIACLIVASKVQSDKFFTNTHYAKVGGLSVVELNHLERDIMKMLRYEMFVRPQLIYIYFKQLLQHAQSVIEKNLHFEAESCVPKYIINNGSPHKRVRVDNSLNDAVAVSSGSSPADVSSVVDMHSAIKSRATKVSLHTQQLPELSNNHKNNVRLNENDSSNGNVCGVDNLAESLTDVNSPIVESVDDDSGTALLKAISASKMLKQRQQEQLQALLQLHEEQRKQQLVYLQQLLGKTTVQKLSSPFSKVD